MQPKILALAIAVSGVLIQSAIGVGMYLSGQHDLALLFGFVSVCSLFTALKASYFKSLDEAKRVRAI